jgi:hypothetical protein
MDPMMTSSRQPGSQPQEVTSTIGANHTTDENDDAFNGEAPIDTFNKSRPRPFMDIVEQADADDLAISTAVDELNPEPEHHTSPAATSLPPRVAPSSNTVTAADKEAYPFEDHTSHYKLLGWHSKEEPLEHEGFMVEHRMPLGTSDEDDHERARYDNKPQPVGTGLDAGVGWLGYLDDARPGVLVTRCPIKLEAPLRRMTPRLNQFKSPEEVVPALMTLEEIAEHYPNHVWGKMLRIFVAEGYKGPAIYNMLPKDARDPLASDVANNRPANYLQHAIGREQDHAMLEEPIPYFRKIRMNKSKGHPKVQKRKMDDDDHDDVVEDDHDEAPTSKRQKLSKTRSKPIRGETKAKKSPVRLSVQTSKAVADLVRKPNSTEAYPLSADEMETQQRVDIQIQRTKMLLSDRLMVRSYDLVHQSFCERLQLVEKEWYEAFNKFLSGYHLFQTDKTVLPPISNQNNEPFEVILTVIEHEQRLNKATATNEAMLRSTAYGVLEFFLASFEESLSAELSFAYQKAPIEVRQAMASYVGGQPRPMLALKAERPLSASTVVSGKSADALSSGRVKSSSTSATLPSLGHLREARRSSSQGSDKFVKERSSSPAMPTGISFARPAKRPAQVRFAQHFPPGTPQRPLQQTQHALPPRSSVKAPAQSPYGMNHFNLPVPATSDHVAYQPRMQQLSSPPVLDALPQTTTASQQMTSNGEYNYFGGTLDPAQSYGPALNYSEPNDFDDALALYSNTNHAAPDAFKQGADQSTTLPTMQNENASGLSSGLNSLDHLLDDDAKILFGQSSTGNNFSETYTDLLNATDFTGWNTEFMPPNPS